MKKVHVAFDENMNLVINDVAHCSIKEVLRIYPKSDYILLFY